MNKLKNMKLFIIIVLVALVNGCKSYEYVYEINSKACEKNGGIDSMPILRSNTHRLIFCKDGTVRWTVNGGH